MAQPDFRVAKRVFATLWPAKGDGVVMLTPTQQRDFIRQASEAFEPVSGGWGARGATVVHLRSARKSDVRNALAPAWRNKAPKKLLEGFDEND